MTDPVGMPKQADKDQAEAKADLAGTTAKPVAAVDVAKLIEEEAAQYREFSLVHARSGTVARVAAALAKLDDAAAVKMHAAKFFQLTGFSAERLEAEVAKKKAAA